MKNIRLIRNWTFLICMIGTSGLIAHAADVSQDETESLALIIRTLDRTTDPETQAALMRGVLRGLEGSRNVAAPENWSRLSQRLDDSPDSDVRELCLQLSQLFGDRAAMKLSLDALKDQSVEPEARRRALHSLLSARSQQASLLLESLLDEPGLNIDAIRGYATMENPVAPTLLLGRYPTMGPDEQRAIIETLASRKRYAEFLLDAIKRKAVAKDDIPVHVARSLNEILGERFASVYGPIKTIGPDREQQLKKYKQLLTPAALSKANASRGRAVFKKTCASCHLLYGDGGNVGPDLTGSNRANLDYILLNSVDPSYDVPAGYKMVTVVTVDGRLINGVVDEEDETKLVLKTAEQPRVVIAKQDIEQRKLSDKSIMPDGQLDQMKPQEVVDLIKYLRTTRQVEMAQ